jgi:xanthine dehydrogenase accessory factor
VRNVFATAAAWVEEGRTVALATLVTLRESATAPVGTTIAVDSEGRIAGNIGAGCYETEIVDAALRTAADGRTRRLDINLTTEDEVLGGAGCGAMMQVMTWRPERAFREDARAIAEGDRDVRVSFACENADGSPATFEHVYAAKETLILVGATALAAELAAIARRMDFKVVVVDPRPAFATPERVPDADAIVRQWPDDYLPGALSGRTSMVVLSHDPKFDLPALRCALRSEAPYIGLLGSRRSQAARRESLRAEGFDERAISRVHGPAGLDIGGRTAAETAISILAEIVASRHKRMGTPLRTTGEAIHQRSEPVSAEA